MDIRADLGAEAPPTPATGTFIPDGDRIRDGFIKIGVGSLATLAIAIFPSAVLPVYGPFVERDVLMFIAEDSISLLVVFLVWKNGFLLGPIKSLLRYGRIDTRYLKRRMIVFMLLGFPFWIFLPSYFVWALLPQIHVGALYIVVTLLKLHLWFLGLGLIYTCIAAIWRG